MATAVIETGTGRRIGARAAVLAALVVCGIVFLLMILLGAMLRLAQAQSIELNPALFYVIMTVHGAGMVGIAGLGGAAIMWHFLQRYIPLSTSVFVANLVFFLIGAALILGAGFIGGFAAGWTFLFPLPAMSGFQWSVNAAACYLFGLVSIGLGFLLLYLDVARGLMSVYRGLGNALGVRQALGLAAVADGPPPAVAAATMVTIVNTLGIVFGAAVLVLSLVNLYVPSFAFDPLVAKNMIYFFGHVFINATIYMAVIAAYEILPLYTHRPWRTNRAFYLAWLASTIMVLIVYPHHLLMDFVMPVWVLIIGQVFSWLSGLPVLFVTVFGTLTNVYRSGIKWDAAAGLVFLGVAGWAVGGIPAVLDATIAVNGVMHNTLWVPGHFHAYLLLGMMAMMLGFMTFLVGGKSPFGTAPVGFWLYLIGGAVFVLAFLAGGSAGAARRYAVHLQNWLPYDKIGVLGAFLALAGAAILVVRFFARVPAAAREDATSP
jgi:cytochrome c oxidase subunit I